MGATQHWRRLKLVANAAAAAAAPAAQTTSFVD